MRADLGFVVDRPPTDRLLDPALGGGALLDMGIYPLTFAHLFLGEPSTVAATASLSEAGADLNLAVSLGYDGGAVSSLTSTMTAWSPRTASIATDRGRIDVPAPFHHPSTVTWTLLAGDPDFDAPPEPETDPRGPDRQRARPRGDRGGPLPAQRRDREPAGAAGRHRRADAADGPDPGPDRPALRPGCCTEHRWVG